MRKMKIKRKVKEHGQAVLIVLLVVAVALGFGLSIISQSVTDVKISKQEQESARAFNAAEAGIEEALKSITVGVGSITVDDIEVDYSVSSETVLSNTVNENESVEVDLTDADLGLNTVTINWVNSGNATENPGTCTASSGGAPASLLVAVIDDADNITRYGVNACDLEADNGMTNISDAGDSPFLRQYDVAVDAGDALVRIRPLYNRTSMNINGNVDLPVQAYSISSTAQAPTLESKAIEVSRTEPATPSVFDYVLFSGTSITK